jgi:hypothetical protein
MNSTSTQSLQAIVEPMIEVARQSHAFQTQILLQAIVTGEQQRIREEQMLWRLGGAILGACLGIGDGFQAQDVFAGLAFSSLAGLSHEVVSQQDRQFLEQCQSLWLVGSLSPLELAQRLGPARSRVLAFDTSWEAPIVFNLHQGYRGEHLIPLGVAGDLAPGFRQSQSMEVMRRHVSAENLSILQGQLYPCGDHTIPLKRMTKIQKEQALATDPHANLFLNKCEPILVESEDSQCIMYQVPIPVHSNF